NVLVSGDFQKQGVAFNNYHDTTGLSITGLDLSTVENGFSGVFNLDGITGNIDDSGYGIIYPTGAFAPADGILADLQGDVPGELGGGAQTIIGSSAKEFLRGGSGDDTLQGNGGSDIINGQTGIDTATGYDASFHLAIQGGHWVVTQGSAPGDQTDTLI